MTTDDVEPCEVCNPDGRPVGDCTGLCGRNIKRDVFPGWSCGLCARCETEYVTCPACHALEMDDARVERSGGPPVTRQRRAFMLARLRRTLRLIDQIDTTEKGPLRRAPAAVLGSAHALLVQLVTELSGLPACRRCGGTLTTGGDDRDVCSRPSCANRPSGYARAFLVFRELRRAYEVD